jgi:hypothetical protein
VGGQIVAAAALSTPWWKRLFRRSEKQYTAGERTTSMQAGSTARRGSGMGRVRIRQVFEWVLGLLVLLGVVGYFAIPNVQQLANRAMSTGIATIGRLVNPRLDPVRPTGFAASDEVEGHPVGQLFDKYANTDWRASSDLPTVTVKFAEPFDLGALIMYSGASDKFTETRRPARIQLTFPDGTTTELELKDDNAEQSITVEKNGIDAFELKVLETYGAAGTPVTLSEIEVFARK